MNNISQISKAKRLTEEEVHAAAEELQLNGGKVGSIEVYRFLGRGSLTTITNFLKTWHQEEKITTLPALILLPETLKKSTEQLIIKVWAESQALAEQELKSQQEALRQAEVIANEKIAEAEAFSEEQAARIEALEAEIEKTRIEMSEQYAEMLKGIEIEQDDRQKAVTQEAVTASKLIAAEKRFDYVNAALIEQQKENQALAAKNIAIKTKLDSTIDNLSFEKKRKSELEDKIYQLECVIGEKMGAESRANNTADDLAKERNENRLLIAKAAKLEGELKAWKEIKPEAKKEALKAKSSETKKKEFKQTEWTEEKAQG
jgi:hypothetical protein